MDGQTSAPLPYTPSPYCRRKDSYACPGDIDAPLCVEAADKDTNVDKASLRLRGAEICSYENGISKCEHSHFLNRIRFASIGQGKVAWVINDVRLQDQGEYKCLLNDKVKQKNNLYVKDSLVCKSYEDRDKDKVPDENPPGAPSSVWLIENWPVIVGIVVIVVAGLVVIAGIVWLRRRRKKLRNRKQADPTHSCRCLM